jgi:hypothetical protein
MKTAISAWLTILAFCTPVPALGQTDMLPAPGFHHLHLNSVDPDAAIAFYTRQFPTTAKASWGGFPALKSPNNVLILFTKLIFYSCGAGMVCKSLILREMRVGFRQNVVPRHDTFVLMYMDFDVIMC